MPFPATVEWLITRQTIAAKYGQPPWTIDDWPVDEVQTEIRISDIVERIRKQG